MQTLLVAFLVALATIWPHMQTLTFGETEEYEELRGDDKLVATHGKGAQVEWDLEAGGISQGLVYPYGWSDY